MKSKAKEIIKDCGVGIGIGCAVIIPGVSAGTIAVITNTFKKIVNAVDNLFSKKFWKSLLTLLPFGLVGVLTVALLIKPMSIALDKCLFAIMALFAGFILGSLPGVNDEIASEKRAKHSYFLGIAGFLVTAFIGVASLIFDFSSSINSLFLSNGFPLYLILIAVGIIGSLGLIVPGLSGSAILLVIGFYQPVISIGEKVISFGPDFWKESSLLATFAFGVLIGFIIFSKLMNKLLTKHKISFYMTIIGLITGSLLSLFINSNIFNYINNGNFKTLDSILTPILLTVGFIIAYILVELNRSKKNKTKTRK